MTRPYTYIDIYIHIYTYIYIYIYVNTRTHTHTHTYKYIDRRTSIICSINSRPYRPLIRSFAYSPIRSRIRSQRSIGACCSCANLQKFSFFLSLSLPYPLSHPPYATLLSCPPPILFSPPQIARGRGRLILERGWEDVGRKIRPFYRGGSLTEIARNRHREAAKQFERS